MISIKITQAGQGSRERPSPSSSSEREAFERGRPPRPWKEKQSKKPQDRVLESNHSSGTSGTNSNSEQRMIKDSQAPHVMPPQQEVPFKLYYTNIINSAFSVKSREVVGGGEEIEFCRSQSRLRSTHCQEN